MHLPSTAHRWLDQKAVTMLPSTSVMPDPFSETDCRNTCFPSEEFRGKSGTAWLIYECLLDLF